MAYNEHLQERIAHIFKERNIYFEAKKMMGGLTFMVNEKMCAGIFKNDLMVRIDPQIQEECLQQPGCHKMELNQRPMKGFVLVEDKAIDMDTNLEQWIQLAIDFNPKANKSKKKKVK